MFFKHDVSIQFNTTYRNFDLYSYNVLYKIQYGGIRRNPRFHNWNSVLMLAADQTDSFRVAQIAVSHGADCYDNAMASACRAGDMPLVLYMIELGADDWAYGFSQACLGGYRALVELMIKKANESPFSTYSYLDWNRGLSMAAASGNIELVRDLLRTGADDYNAALISATFTGDLRIAQLMIGLGADNFNGAMENAVFGGQNAMVYQLVKYGACNWSAGLRTACACGNAELVSYFINKGASAKSCENCHGYKHKK